MLVRLEKISDLNGLGTEFVHVSDSKLNNKWIWKNDDIVIEVIKPEWADKPVFHDGQWCWEGDGNKKIVVNKFLTDPVNGQWYKKIIDFCGNNVGQSGQSGQSGLTNC